MSLAWAILTEGGLWWMKGSSCRIATAVFPAFLPADTITECLFATSSS